MAHESLISGDRRVLFRETFNSAAAVVRNGGVVTGGVTLENGVATFDGVAGTKILYPRWTFNKDFSVRIRFSRDGHPSARENMFSYNGNLQFFRLETTGHLGGYVRSSDPVTVFNLVSSIDVCDGKMHEAVFSLQYGGNVRYFIDGAVYSDTSLVFTGYFDLIELYIGAYTLGREFGGGLELVEIYDGALSSEEVALLNRNALYKDVRNGLVGQWLVNGSLVDKAGDNNGTNHGSTIGHCGVDVRKFNGTSGYVDIGANLNSVFNNVSPWSILGWVNTSDDNLYDPPFSKGDWGVGFSLQGIYGRIRGGDGGGNSFDFDLWNTIIRNSIWHHIGIFYDGSAFYSYVDGRWQETNNWSFGIGDTSSKNLEFGRMAISGQYFIGYQSDMRVYNRTLSAEDMTAVFQSSRGRYGV